MNINYRSSLYVLHVHKYIWHGVYSTELNGAFYGEVDNGDTTVSETLDIISSLTGLNSWNFT
jgi:hypothetical protein